MTKTDQGKRLGGLLRYRRMELDPAWRDRETFATQHHLSVRVVNDLENANRRNFTPATVAGFEVAYQLTPGSLRRTLAGGDLEPAGIPEPRRERQGFQVIQGGAGQFQHNRDLDLDPRVLDVMRELNAAIQAKRETNPDAAGTDIFGDDPVLGRIWDLNVKSEIDRLIPMATYVLVCRGEVDPAHQAG